MNKALKQGLTSDSFLIRSACVWLHSFVFQVVLGVTLGLAVAILSAIF